MKKIKIGCFGAFRGLVLIQSLTVIPEAELVAVCDRNPKVLDQVRQLADAYGMKVTLYTDFEQFFLHDMDAVILANYALEHAPYAVRFLRSGRHVMSEVLACETMAQAVELIEAVEESGKVYAYAENYCYMDDTFEMRRLYENQEIGEVIYAEGAYLHDQTRQHSLKTAGDPMHWRNRMYSTQYCTHAITPILFTTGTRPVKVTGLEAAKGGLSVASLGYRGGGLGIMMITLDNGAILRSVVGGVKREPFDHNLNFTVYGTKGTLETHSIHDNNISFYKEGSRFCRGEMKDYYPERFIAAEEAQAFLKGAQALSGIFTEATLRSSFHRCGDFYPGYFFVQKILGREEGRYSIDVFMGVEATICGILAYRSILNGSTSVEIPDLRIPANREPFRNDRACTDPAVAGDQLIPARPGGEPDIPKEVYEYVHELWAEGKSAEHGCPGYED